MIHFYNQQSVSNIIFNDSIVNMLYNLKDRWTDECRYENINDYADAVENKLRQCGLNFSNLTMTTTPFGFKALIAYMFQCGEKRMVTLQVKIDAADEYSWTVQSE